MSMARGLAWIGFTPKIKRNGVVPQRLVVGSELDFARPETLLLRVSWEKYIESFDRAGLMCR